MFIKFLRFSIAAVLSAAAVGAPAASAPPVAPARQQRNLSEFDAVWSLIARKYYDRDFHGLDWKATGAAYRLKAAAAADDSALYAAINQMIGLLKDSHTHLLTDVQTRQLRTEKVVRTGMDLLSVGGHWTVAGVAPGSPAEAAGVEPGWVLVARAGRPF